MFGFRTLGTDTDGTPKVMNPVFQPSNKDCVKLPDKCNKLSSVVRAEKGQLAHSNGNCRPAAEYGGKADNRKHQILHRACVRVTYGKDVDPHELSDRQKDESSLRFRVKDEYNGIVTCTDCSTDIKAGVSSALEKLLQHNCKGETSTRCQYCEKTADELDLNYDDSHRTGMHVINAMSNHERFSCPCNPKFCKSWADLIAFLKKQGRPTNFGEIPFLGYPKGSEAELMWKKIYRAVGKDKSIRKHNGNRTAKPVEGDKRAQLEELGYTVENGFLYD